MDIQFRFKSMAAGIAFIAYASTPAIAEDIEIYTTTGVSSAAIQPNVMFIIDTSGSMGAKLTVPNSYDYTVDYSGCYKKDMIYFTGSGTVADCNTVKDFFKKEYNRCDASLQLYDKGVVIDTEGPLLKQGFYADQVAQFQPLKNFWRELDTKNDNERDYDVECFTDSGVHGKDDATNPYIIDGTGWTSTVPANPAAPHPVWANGDGSVQWYDGNYLNYLTDTSVGTTQETRMQVAKDAVEAIVTVNNNINIGLMRFDGKATNNEYEGGAVMYPILDVKASRNDFNSRLKVMTAGGYTPLAETYYEALLYFGGKAVDYGDTADPSNQTGTTELGNPKNYETPITHLCQKNYIVYLTDGAPTRDYVDATRRGTLPGFDVNSCFTDPYPGTGAANIDHNKDAFISDTSTIDNCLDELSGWAKNNDVAERSFQPHNGEQNITTYTIGFDFPADANLRDQYALRLLQDTATKGGGTFYEAKSKDSLLGIFNTILAEILAVNTTFSAPAVSVNAYNRATNLEDLYFSLFKPGTASHWDGNLKRYKLATVLDVNGEPVPEIQDALSQPAIDPNSGFFTTTSQSFWTQAVDAPDGAETALGGAAGQLTTTRNVYTFTGTYSDSNGVSSPSNGTLTSGANALDKANAAVTEAMLGITGFPEKITGTPYRDTLLDWAYGLDVLGSVPTAARRIMGDPLHAEPALIQYGEFANGDPDLVAYMATNDGYLHGINTITGNELWSFVPQELLANLNVIFEDTGTAGKAYGLDGNVVPWINDANKDGDLNDAGDLVYLYMGQRRGGSDIFSFDVSNRNSPRLRWVIKGGTGDFAEMGQSWSNPNVERLKLNGTTKNVLIFGGGYDTTQDTVVVRTQDSVGRSIYIVDADTGVLLWRAGPDAGADLQLTDMQYSIPGRIKPLDVDSNGFVDQLYFGDMGGQLWRFDIQESETTSNLSTLITGGRIADLAVDNSVTDARRFYYPPDVAVIIEDGQSPYLSIVAASGYRAHPLDQQIQDRMYMLRMDDIYNAPADYNTTITEADLLDTTDNAIGGDNGAGKQAAAVTNLGTAKGWFITFNELDGSFIGEKGLAEPLILGGVALVTTFIPEDLDPNSKSCVPKEGTGTLYFVNVTDGTPTFNLSGTVDKTREDRKTYLKRGGIPPSPSVIITEGGTPSLCIGTECASANLGYGVQKMYWYEVEQ